MWNTLRNSFRAGCEVDIAEVRCHGTDGGLRLLGIQAMAILATIVYSVVATFVIVKAISLVMRLRADAREEGLGLDFSQHGEEAYSRGEGAVLLLDGREG